MALPNLKASSTQLAGLVSGGSRVSFRAPIEADRDWAVLRLHKPICARGGLSFAKAQSVRADPTSAASVWVARIQRHSKTGAPHFTVHRCQISPANANALAHNQAMSDFAAPSRLLFHDCDAGAIASGSPLMSVYDDDPHMVGMHIGTYVRSRVVKNDHVITQRLSSRPIAHIAVKASEFTRPVFDLVTAK